MHSKAATKKGLTGMLKHLRLEANLRSDHQSGVLVPVAVQTDMAYPGGGVESRSLHLL